MARQWKGQDDVNCLNQSKFTQSRCGGGLKLKLMSLVTQKSGVVMVVDLRFQSQPCPDYTNGETLEGSRLM
eukprot:scaffold34860_cov58-Cyclotella_meneghiniana.AAC.2